jgi:3-oxoacyl-[acyl-carrier-protein] synthase II
MSPRPPGPAPESANPAGPNPAGPTPEGPVAAAITGLGVVSAFGWGVAPFRDGIAAGACAIGGFDRFDHRAYRTHVAGQVPPEPAGLAARHRGWHRLSLADRFAVAAAAEAMAAAGLEAGFGDGRRAGVYFSSSTGGMLEGEEFYAALAPGRRPRLGPGLRLIANQQVSAPGEVVARALGVHGPVETVSSACASGTLALGRALDALRAGEVDVAIAGGSDSLCRITFGGFNSLRSVDEWPCRPFRDDRAGLSLGEGAAVLVLERAADARARGARPRAFLAGAGAAADAHHMTAPHPQGDGAARALAAALADAATAPGEVGSINSHGTGTQHNDDAEWRALVRVFGEARARELPLAATKACVGHLLGSAGALEAVATVLCLEAGAMHPAPGGGVIDPATPVALALGRPRQLAAPAPAISLNLAFGGCNAALVLIPSSGAA